LVMITVIVVTLLRWIAHLSTFGRMSDIIDRVEAAATTSLTAYAESPSLGANPLTGPDHEGTHVFADKPGYVVFVDLPVLDRAAADAGRPIQVVATVGRVADATTPLAIVEGEAETELQGSIRQAFRIEAHRTYEQDPRLGVIALTEIGSRALSPATNDPGTAIEILGALQRVFTATLTTTRHDDVDYPMVWVRSVTLEDLVMDAFRTLSRDGAGILEVQMRLQKCLAALAATAPEHADTFRAAATLALQRSSVRLDDADTAVLGKLHRRLNG